MPAGSPKKSILIVDDDASLLAMFARVLERAGYAPKSTQNAEHALDWLGEYEFDSVVTDLSMPGMPGLEFIRKARTRAPDVPIVVITGVPDFDSAVQSINCGVFRYVTKPVPPHELVRAVSDAVHHKTLTESRKSALEGKNGSNISPVAALHRALEGVWLAVQPIVNHVEGRVVAYEALLRTNDEVLRDPMAVFSVAERIDQLNAVGSKVRAKAAELMEILPDNVVLFMNLHPRDLLDPTLFDRTSTLSRHAHRIVLEVTERASLGDVPDAQARIEELKGLGFRIALDDMGAGYAGLTSLASMKPHFVKIDLSLVRDVDRDPLKQTLIRTIVRLASELDIEVVAEGVETPAERHCLADLGCSLFQGYLFARPGAPFPEAVL